MEIDLSRATEFLMARHGADASEVATIGAGSWSRAYGFRLGGTDLVVRFGEYINDFRKDQAAFAFTRPGLPIPEVLEIGEAFGGYYAVSRRVFGQPLESVPAAEWPALFRSIIGMIDAIRAIPVSPSEGYGNWMPHTDSGSRTWREVLLDVAVDRPEMRTHGWKDMLRRSGIGDDTFNHGLSILESIAPDDPGRSVVHNDLLNRNVLYMGDRIAGVFDWANSFYGDFLYEIACMMFWAPWHPGMDANELVAFDRARLVKRGMNAADYDARLRACLIVIGLDHLGYNAFIGNEEDLVRTNHRLAAFL